MKWFFMQNRRGHHKADLISVEYIKHSERSQHSEGLNIRKAKSRSSHIADIIRRKTKACSPSLASAHSTRRDMESHLDFQRHFLQLLRQRLKTYHLHRDMAAECCFARDACTRVK
jgi:hypothetical protein